MISHTGDAMPKPMIPAALVEPKFQLSVSILLATKKSLLAGVQ
jgi:hypothetical protein